MAKICSRILAVRLGEIIKNNPRIMTDAQRGFLRNGSVLQCIHAALDVFEDAKEKGQELYAVAYDLEKAYDSVQLYSIIAALERFNLPSGFVNFVRNGLFNAQSCFKTPYGLTKPFQLRASVRQGDPLAPLLFIMVVDALHEGLKCNPLSGQRTGYRFQGNLDLVISSLGYADDTMVFAETWSDVWKAHTWVREFCRAHNLSINWKKTRFFGSDWNGEKELRGLWPVQGDKFDEKTSTFPLQKSQKIVLRSPAESFRYLGVWINMSLTWETQRERMNSTIMCHLRRMRSNKLQAHEKVMMTRELILAQLDMGFQVATIPQLVLQKWNSAIVHTLVSGEKWPTAFSLNPQAINCLANIPDLATHYQVRRLGEAVIRLNSQFSIAGMTARARWDKLERRNGRIGPRSTNRLADILSEGRRLLGAEVQERQEVLWDLEDLQKLIAGRIPKGSLVTAFTDGSTEPRSEISGAGICLVSEGKEIWAGGFRINSEGRNYVSEYAAACLAIALVPSDSPLELIEDNQGAISSQKEDNPTERRRVRSAARAWCNTFRFFKNTRKARTRISYIRAHTQRGDFCSQGNEAADEIAKWARRQQLPPLDPPGEERYVLIVGGKVVKNDVFGPLKEFCLRKALNRWAALRSQGALVRIDSQGVLDQSFRAMRLAHEYNKGDLWLFYVFAVCNWLPTNYRRSKGVDRDGFCQLCTGNVMETQKHLLQCPALLPSIQKLQNKAASFLDKLLQGNSINDPQEDFVTQTVAYLRRFFVRDAREGLLITDAKLFQLVRMFVSTNKDRMGLSRKNCKKHIERILQQRKCDCPRFRKHSCYLRNCWRTPITFLHLVRDILHVNCEGMADALSHSAAFGRWCSEFPGDTYFGAEFDFFQAKLEGENTFVNPPFNSVSSQSNILIRVVERCLKLVQTLEPTRVVLLLPTFSGRGGTFALERALASGYCSIIAQFPPGNFFFEPPDSYYLDSKVKRAFDGGVSILLISSPTSLVSDPIDWFLWKTRVRDWAAVNGAIVNFPPHPLDHSLPGMIPRAIRTPSSLLAPLSLLPWLEAGRVAKLPAEIPQLESRSADVLLKLGKSNWLAVSLGVFLGDIRRSKLPDDLILRWASAALWDFYNIWELRGKLVFKRRKFQKSLGTCRSPFHGVPMRCVSGRKPCGCVADVTIPLPFREPTPLRDLLRK